jgi:hypothetical protein
MQLVQLKKHCSWNSIYWAKGEINVVMAARLPPKIIKHRSLKSGMCWSLVAWTWRTTTCLHTTLTAPTSSFKNQNVRYGKLLNCNSVTVGKDQKWKRKYLAEYPNYQAGETKDYSRILRVTFVTFGLKKKGEMWLFTEETSRSFHCPWTETSRSS